MAKLKKVFKRSLETAFGVFEEAVSSATLIQVGDDDGFDDPVETETPIRTIVSSFRQEDIETLPYGDQIQATDLKCLIPGVDLDSLTLSTEDTIRLDTDYDGVAIGATYSVVDHDVDAMNVLYTVLLRDA